MKKHVKNYLKGSGNKEGDFIACERCGGTAVDIHHIKFKGQGGSDEYVNLIALCRSCHQKAHGIEGNISAGSLFNITELR